MARYYNKNTYDSVIELKTYEVEALRKEIKKLKTQLSKYMESNKLIAEFMGYHTYESNGYDMVKYSDCNERTLQDTHYHTSWNWLMPVVEKCLNTEEKTDGHHYFINDALLTCNIEVVYDRVVEFIKDCEKKSLIDSLDSSEIINK